mgnify:CR=1 FL=1
MTMSMFNMIAITNRGLCPGDFLTQIRRIAKANPYRIILREKDLSELNYLTLAGEVLSICAEEGAVCTLHTSFFAAKTLQCPRIHLPLHQLEQNRHQLEGFVEIGASVHSVAEAKLAQRAGATYVTAGHVFTTDCKAGVPPRGLDFLQAVCEAVEIPVYGIGGIGPQNIKQIAESGAAGACIMSGFMKETAVSQYLAYCKRNLKA